MMFLSKSVTLGPVIETDHQKVDSLCLLSKGPKSITGMNGKDYLRICFIKSLEITLIP